MTETITKLNYPFCEAAFFDRFESGRTILFLHFLKEVTERTEPILDSRKAKRTCLVSREVVGIYQGHDDIDVRLRTTDATVDTVPAANIRNIKELKIDEVQTILCKLTKSLCRLPSAGDADLPAIMTAFNALRAMIDQHAILIPRAPTS